MLGNDKSAGGDVTSCTPMRCAAGEYATLVGSTDVVLGCTQCAVGS